MITLARKSVGLEKMTDVAGWIRRHFNPRLDRGVSKPTTGRSR
jgi:hypothetical protein